jgi:hypothetical protein
MNFFGITNTFKVFLEKELLNETYQLPHGSFNNYQVIEIMDKKKKETTRIKLCNLIR